MFFNKQRKIDLILNYLDFIESYIKDSINKIDFNNYNQKIMGEIINISNIIKIRKDEDISIYGEIMICTEKLLKNSLSLPKSFTKLAASIEETSSAIGGISNTVKNNYYYR